MRFSRLLSTSGHSGYIITFFAFFFFGWKSRKGLQRKETQVCGLTKFAFLFLPQHWWRGVLERERFTRLRSAAIFLQRAARKMLETKHKSAARIQALIRGVMARKHLKKLQESALRIQVRDIWWNIETFFCKLLYYLANILVQCGMAFFHWVTTLSNYLLYDSFMLLIVDWCLLLLSITRPSGEVTESDVKCLLWRLKERASASSPPMLQRLNQWSFVTAPDPLWTFCCSVRTSVGLWERLLIWVS